MDTEKTIKLISNDGKTIELSSKAAANSGLLRGMQEDYPEETEFPLNNVKGGTLEKVKEYLAHYQDKELSIIEKPLKSNFQECVNEWDYKFLGEDNDSLLDLIQAANYMDIKPLLELASAKVASKIRGTTTESIRKSFNITSLTPEEQDQLNKDKDYLEKNL